MPPHTWNSFQKLIKQKTKFIVFVQHSCCGEILWAHHHTWARWREYQIYQTNTWRRNTAQRKMKYFVFRQDISIYEKTFHCCYVWMYVLNMSLNYGFFSKMVYHRQCQARDMWEMRDGRVRIMKQTVLSQYIIIANTGESEYFDWFSNQVGNLIFAVQ